MEDYEDLSEESSLLFSLTSCIGTGFFISLTKDGIFLTMTLESEFQLCLGSIVFEPSLNRSNSKSNGLMCVCSYS